MSNLLEELAEVGFPVGSVDELTRLGVRYTTAVPVLVHALPNEPDFKTKEWIARALSVPWARPTAIPALLEEFRSLPLQDKSAEMARWAIGNAFDALWDDAFFDEFTALATDQRYGIARQMLVLGFGKSREKQRATEVLLTLVDDPDVDGHAVSALAKLGQPASRDALVAASSHSKAWIRKAAVRGLKKLDRAAGA